MKKILLSSALCASMMFAANSEYKYEITPLVGGVYTEGNIGLDRDYFDAGLALGFNLDDSMFDQVELGFLRSIEDVEYRDAAPQDTGVTRVFTNLIKEYPMSDSLSFYGLVGAGLEFFDDASYDNNEDGLFGNYGLGIKYKVADSIALKADVRHLIETDHGDNNLLYTVGLAIPFGEKAAPAPVVVPEPEPVVVPMVKEEPKDTDGDGVLDSADKCPDTPKGNIVDADGCSLKVDLNINFKTDSAVIDTTYDSKIKKFADFMRAFPAVKGKIEAHTDSVGSDAYNQKLSEKRAASAVKALEAQGIEATRLDSVGYGEMNPKASNETAEGRAMNRRVEGSIQQ